MADLSWVDDRDVQRAIQDLSQEFAGSRRPQPIAEGKDNPGRSSSQLVGRHAELRFASTETCSGLALYAFDWRFLTQALGIEDAKDGDMEAPAPAARQPNQ
jgi:hypothetical protein